MLEIHFASCPTYCQVRTVGFALLRRSSEVTRHRIAELYIRSRHFLPRTSSNLPHPAPDVSGTRRIPHAGVPSISIKDTPQQTAGLVAVEVANGHKAILTLIHSLSCGRPTAYVPRGHYFRFNGAAWRRAVAKKRRKGGWQLRVR